MGDFDQVGHRPPFGGLTPTWWLNAYGIPFLPYKSDLIFVHIGVRFSEEKAHHVYSDMFSS